MAKPDLDDGWLKYAHELDAALAVADFTKGARIVLHEVFAQVFGPAKRPSATISPSTLGGVVGLAREQISRGVRELTEAGALERLEDGTFRFIKDYESWRHKGAPRLSHKEAAFCRFAPAVAMAYRHGDPYRMASRERDDSVTARDDSVTLTTVDTVTESSRERDSLVTQTVTESSRAEESPPDPPNRNGRAEFENGELRRYGGAGAARGDVTEPDGLATFEAFVAAVAVEFSPKVAAYIKANGSDIIAEFAGRFDCYLAALRAAAKLREEPTNVHAWCLKVGRKFKRNGIPPDPGPLSKSKAKSSADPYSKLLAEMEDD